jgi:hypothetical protein
MIVFFLFLTTIFIVAIGLPPLLKKKTKKGIGLFLALVLMGFGLSVAKSQHIDLPNPSDWIIFLFKPISELVFQSLA